MPTDASDFLPLHSRAQLPAASLAQVGAQIADALRQPAAGLGRLGDALFAVEEGAAFVGEIAGTQVGPPPLFPLLHASPTVLAYFTARLSTTCAPVRHAKRVNEGRGNREGERSLTVCSLGCLAICLGQSQYLHVPRQDLRSACSH